MELSLFEFTYLQINSEQFFENPIFLGYELLKLKPYN